MLNIVENLWTVVAPNHAGGTRSAPPDAIAGGEGIGVRAGGQGDRFPTFRTGIIPPPLYAVI